MVSPLRKVNPGQEFSMPASSFNAFVDAARYVQAREADAAGNRLATSFALQQMQIVEVGGDFLRCVRVGADGSAGTLDVFVAKPWTLRRTPFDGQTRNGKEYTYADNVSRTVTEGSATEDQRITPDYEVGDVIFAALCDVLGQIDPEDTNTGDRTVLVDANVDGRAWALEF